MPEAQTPEPNVVVTGGALPAGTVVAQNYRVLGQLGAGGMGTVYLAENITLPEQRVVVKVLTGGDRGAGLDEARRMVAITHQNVVHVYAHDAGHDCVVMEHLDGEALSARMDASAAGGGLGVLEGVRIGVPVAEALAAIHARGLVHRDIKPANIMLSPLKAGRRTVEWLKVIDFGLALSVGKQAAQAAGTPEYVSPEQYRNEPAHPGNDVYALGAVLFELLAGRLPYVADSAPKVLRLHLDAPVPHLMEVRDVSTVQDEKTLRTLQALDELLVKMLAKDVAARPSASDVARELVRLETQFASSGTYVGPAPRNPSGNLGAKRETLVLPRGEARVAETARAMAAVRPSKTPWVVAGVAVVLLLVLGGLLWGQGQSGAGTSAAVSPPAPAPVVVSPVAPVPGPPLEVKPVTPEPAPVPVDPAPVKEELAPTPVAAKVTPRPGGEDRVILVPTPPEEKVVTVDDAEVRKCNQETLEYSKRLEQKLRAKFSAEGRDGEVDGAVGPLKRLRQQAAANRTVTGCEGLDEKLDAFAQSRGLE